MPQNRQAGGVVSGPNWPWRRLLVSTSAVLAFVLCAALVKSTLEAFAPPPANYLFYDPPLPPSLAGYSIFVLLLFGAIDALWRGRVWVLSLGWLATLGAFFIDFGLKAPFFLFALVGLGLALAGRSPQITRISEDVK